VIKFNENYCGPCLIIELNCEETILNFSDKNYSKFNISHTIGLKIMKSLSKNPLVKGFPTIARVCPNFLI